MGLWMSFELVFLIFGSAVVTRYSTFHLFNQIARA